MNLFDSTHILSYNMCNYKENMFVLLLKMIIISFIFLGKFLLGDEVALN